MYFLRPQDVIEKNTRFPDKNDKENSFFGIFFHCAMNIFHVIENEKDI